MISTGVRNRHVLWLRDDRSEKTTDKTVQNDWLGQDSELSTPINEQIRRSLQATASKSGVLILYLSVENSLSQGLDLIVRQFILLFCFKDQADLTEPDTECQWVWTNFGINSKEHTISGGSKPSLDARCQRSIRVIPTHGPYSYDRSNERRIVIALLSFAADSKDPN